MDRGEPERDWADEADDIRDDPEYRAREDARDEYTINENRLERAFERNSND
jgi:hypothetical protein